MASNKKVWVFTPPKAQKAKLSDAFKKQLTERIEKILEEVLRPKHIQKPPEGHDFNYLSGLHSKWYRNYFYICGTYTCPSERASVPSFEAKFSRMEFFNEDSINLAYMRHTGKFWELFEDQTLEESIKIVTTQSHFLPFT